ncbi:hypothetical protein GCM10027418_09240 [Mariniluteicoccus endophyticus]
MSESGTTTQELLALVKQLSARLESVETELADIKARSDAEIDEDVIMAISAAVSAYLGHRAKVKAVHFRRTSSPWTQQGRAAVQSRTVPHSR